MRRWCAAAVVGASLLVAAPSRAADPEQPGPYQYEVWANPPGTPIPCPAGIFYPTDAPCPGAPVALVHGGGESGAYKVKMAQLLASRGMVAVVPSYPNLLASPSQADADKLNALMDWVVQQSTDASTPIAGKVDAAKWGVGGHSNGGIMFVAASDNPKFQAIVGWDAVAALDATPGLHGASLHLIADAQNCGGGSRLGYNGAPAPKAMGVISNSSHCDFDDPKGPLCQTFCGTDAYDVQAAAMIERYSVAWFTCLLGHDPSMQAYVDFTQAQTGVSAHAAEGNITCQAACGGGSGGSGGGGAGAPGVDGGAGTGATAAPSKADEDGGCGCRSAGERGEMTRIPAAAALALGAWFRRRSRFLSRR